MRAADAAAAGLPVYAEILGWGLASAAEPGQGPPHRDKHPHPHQDQPTAGAAVTAGQLAAMRTAYEMARLDPAEVELIEGCGSAVPATDEAELAALGSLRAGAAARQPRSAAVSANIGAAGAAAGAAGLIKAVLAVANGVLPPSTGIRTPHPMLPGRPGRAAAAGPPSRGRRHPGTPG